MSSQIDYQRFRSGESCTEEGCRARKFYIEDGKKFCQRGHEQVGFTQTQQDEDDWKSQGKKSRKQKAERDPAKTLLRGAEARELYLQCFQLILWKQCHWLINVKKLPPELETVVRDLWGLRLGYVHRDGEERGFSSTTAGTTVMYSSAEEGDTDTDGSQRSRRSMSSRRSRKSRREENPEKLPLLLETLTLIYLGVVLMRLPLSLGELARWVKKDEMVYNRAIKEIPNEMKVRLPIQYRISLEVREPLNGGSLSRSIRHLMEFYVIEFGLVFPGLNIPILLFKHVRDLGVPVEIYPAAQRLVAMLNIEFTYSRISRRETSNPELDLVALIVIATKLSQPFDEIKRVPEQDTDASAMKLDWNEWNKIMAEAPVDGLKRGTEMGITDQDVIGMNGEMMDDYMDWFQRTWLDDRESKMPETILERFPLQDVSPLEPEPSDIEKKIDRLKRVQQSMTPQEVRTVIDARRENRPGEHYRRYKKITDIPEKAKPFFELAAENAGMPLKLLVQNVYDFEGKLIKWSLEERRKEAMNAREEDDSMDSESSEEDEG